MISLLYLKHAFNESHEGVVERVAETPTCQYLSGKKYVEHRWPCDPSLLVRFRRSLGEEVVNQLLAGTMKDAVIWRVIDKQQFTTVIFESTGIPKATAQPSDSKTLETARSKLFKIAFRSCQRRRHQTLADLCQRRAPLKFKAARYGHSKQFMPMRKAIKRQHTIFRRLRREIQPKARVDEIVLCYSLNKCLANKPLISRN